MIAVATLNTRPALSASGKAVRLTFEKPVGATLHTRTIWLPVSHSSFDGTTLAVAEWLLSKDLGSVIDNGYTLRGGTILPREVIAPAAPVSQGLGLQPAIIRKGFFTVEKGDGTHRTFRIKTSPRSGKTVIGVMTGSSNLAYEWFAYVSGGELRFFGRNVFNVDEMRANFDTIKGDPTTAGLRYARESMNCMRCNKLLTTPTSLNIGLGPVCDKLANPFG